MRKPRTWIWTSITVAALLLCAMTGATAGAAVSLTDAIAKALQQSQLRKPGGKPFHLKITIAETSASSPYQATIQEYWAAPDKWRREVVSQNFSQTLITNGDMVSESDTGEYFPFWLNEFIVAFTEEVPKFMVDAVQQTHAEVVEPPSSLPSTVIVNRCSNLPGRVDLWIVCFDGGHGLLSSVFTKGYAAEFKDYKKFGNTWYATKVTIEPDYKTIVEARVTELTELGETSEPMFRVDQPTPTGQRIRSVRIDEETMRQLVVGSKYIQWPAVGEGLLKGGCAIYISADRSGKVREVMPGGCDNAALQEPLRQQVMQWQLKPAVVDGTRVQVEALLGFPFQTELDASKGVPTISNEEARKLASNIVEPQFPPDGGMKGSEFTVQISVNETGKLTGVQNPRNLPTPIFMAIYSALGKWRFSPYMKDGKPQYFHADMTFQSR